MKICLDAGHYGKYNRSKVVPGYYESEMNWKLHNYLAEELESYGVEVIKTRADQKKDLGLTARGKKAKGCDLFLSIHSNACDVENIDYPLVITMQDGKGDALGLEIAKKIEGLMDTRQAGKIMKKRGTFGGEWYGVLSGAASVKVMGLIIEHSFHSNIKATNWLLNDDNLKLMARSEADIIAKHFGLSKGTQPSDKPSEKLEENKPAAESKKALEIGDIVTFTGSKHYKNASAAEGSSCKPGTAKITAISEGAKHPYHLVRTGSVGPYGWVDQADIVEARQATVSKPAESSKLDIGSIVTFTGNKQYSSANSVIAKGASAGQAKITATAPGKKHPFHLVRTGSVGPYGWVDEADIAEAANNTVSAQPSKPWEPAVGDIVKFTGNKQYSSADGAVAKAAVAGQAKISAKAHGKKHPYHLVRTGKTGPWGWVDAGTFQKD